MTSLPPVLLELLRSDDPDQLAQAVEFLRARFSDREALELLYTHRSGQTLPPLSLGSAQLSGVCFSHPLAGATLSDADLSRAILAGISLAGADLRRADLRRADLQRADLTGVDLTGADLTGADLRSTDLHSAVLGDARFSGALYDEDTRWPGAPPADALRLGLGASLVRADLSSRDLRKHSLRGADLTGADLTGANLHGVDLRGARLQGARLARSDLRDAVFHYADLSGADARGARHSGADFRCADLTGASGLRAGRSPQREARPPARRPPSRWRLAGQRRRLQSMAGMLLSDIDWSGADLRSTDLRGAILHRVDLRGADLRGAHLGGAVLRRVRLDGARLDGADLRGVDADQPLPDASSPPPAALAPDAAHRDLWEQALATDRPADWRRLGEAEGGDLGALRMAWARWQSAAGRRLELGWGADRPVLHTWDVRARLRAWEARYAANAPFVEGSRAWAAEAARLALSRRMPSDIAEHCWTAISGRSNTEPLPRWTPLDPLVLLPASLGAPRFPTTLGEGGLPDMLRHRWPVRGWLWAGLLSHLDVRATAAPALVEALLGAAPLPQLETLRVESEAALRALAAGPPRPSLRALYVEGLSERLAVPDLSGVLPGLERLEIHLVYRPGKHARTEASVSLAPLSLPRLRRLVVSARGTLMGTPPPLTEITIAGASLPGLQESTLRAERIKGMWHVMPTD